MEQLASQPCRPEAAQVEHGLQTDSPARPPAMPFALPPGIAAAAWVAEGRAVCEGIEHETALPVDPAEKAPTLRAATAYFTDQLVAKEAARRQGQDKGQR